MIVLLLQTPALQNVHLATDVFQYPQNQHAPQRLRGDNRGMHNEPRADENTAELAHRTLWVRCVNAKAGADTLRSRHIRHGFCNQRHILSLSREALALLFDFVPVLIKFGLLALVQRFLGSDQFLAGLSVGCNQIPGRLCELFAMPSNLPILTGNLLVLPRLLW